MNQGKVLLGLLAGVAIGATLGILLAPDKGSKTRKKILKKSDAFVEELEDKFNDFADRINRKYQMMSKKADNMAKSGQHKLEEVEAKVIHAEK